MVAWYSKTDFVRRSFRRRHRTTEWLLIKAPNAMIYIQALFFAYFQLMYLWAVCFHMIDSHIRTSFYVCVFEGLAVMAVWSFFAIICNPPTKIPDKFKVDQKTEEALRAVETRTEDRYTMEKSITEIMRDQMIILRDFCHERGVCTVERERFGERIRYCYECALVKPDRAHHCSSCGFCVLKFDHHCTWINQCIHYGNYKAFLLYLVYSVLLLFWIFVTSIEGFVLYFAKQNWLMDFPAFVTILLGMIGSLIFLYYPFGGLFNFHRRLVVLNKTTCEQMKFPRIKGDPRADYNMGTYENLKQVFGWGFWLFPVNTQIGDGIHYKIRYHCKPEDCTVIVGVKPPKVSTPTPAELLSQPSPV